MSAFKSAFWAEALKARRAKITWLTAAGLMLMPLFGGLFMLILKNPEQARAMGIISLKAQLTAGTADWITFFEILTQGIAVGGIILFSLVTAWLFGREFSDYTVKELLAIPTSRSTLLSAKFVLLFLWLIGLTVMVFLVGLGVGWLVDIPGWSTFLAWETFTILVITAFFIILLMPYVALFASFGRGYLLPMGWTIFVLALANIVSLLGWGDWFPWAVPMLFGGMGNTSGQISPHSLVILVIAFLIGSAATYLWWNFADQIR